MRGNIYIPRILKINWIDKLKISVVFNNGESRVIDFEKLLVIINIDNNSPAFKLFDEEYFKTVQLVDNTLSWDNIDQYITLKNGDKIKVPFEIGADVLYENSTIEQSKSLMLGELIRKERLKKGLTQQDLAFKSGTSRSYISKIENNRSDLEIATLRKIVEIGLGQKLEINIK